MPDERLTFILEARDLASGTTRKVRGEMSGLGAAVGQMKKQFVGGVAAGNLLSSGVMRIGDALVDSVGSAVQFQTNMLNVNSIAKLSRADFDAATTGVLDLSKELPQSAETLANGLYDIASSGFKGAEGMKVLDASARAASAGLSTTEVSSAGLTAVLNAYHLSADEATRISDIMFQTVNLGVLTFDELAAEIGKTTALSSPLGVSFEEVSAALSLMTRNGLDAANATTQINAIMANLLKPSKQAVELAEKLGLGWNSEALEARGLSGVLADLVAKTGGNHEQMATLLGDQRAIRGAFVLAADGGGQLNDELAKMEAAGGATSSALSEQEKGLAFQMTILTNNLQAFVDELVLDAAPALTEFVGFARDLVGVIGDVGNAFRSLDDDLVFFHDDFKKNTSIDIDPKEWAFAIHDGFVGAVDAIRGGTKASKDALTQFDPGAELGIMYGRVPKAIAEQEARIYAATHRTIVTPVEQVANEARATAMREFAKLPKDISDAIENNVPAIDDGLDALKKMFKHSLSDTEKIAKLEGILSSKALAKGLKDERYDVRAAARELQRDARQELAELKSGAKDAAADGGATYAEFLRKQKAKARAAGRDVAEGAEEGLRIDASGAGSSIINSWIQGMVNNLLSEHPEVNNAIHRFAEGTLGTSLPKRGPFSARPLANAAKSIVEHYTGTMADELAAALPAVQGGMTGLGEVGGPARASGGYSGGMGSLTVVFQSTFPPTPAQGAALARSLGPELERWRRKQRVS